MPAIMSDRDLQREYELEAQKRWPGGSKYKKGVYVSIADLSKAVRADIKQAVKDKHLPQGKYSVTSKSYSGGRSQDIEIKAIAIQVVNIEFLSFKRDHPNDIHPREIGRYTAAASKALVILQAIQNQYNYNNSDSQSDYFDVNFYGHVKVAWELEQAEDHAFRAGVALPVYEEPAEVVSVMAVGTEIRHNTEKNGIEVVFAEKPAESIRQILIEHGFRWSRFQQLWYARYSIALIGQIEALLG
jgi:hypothetical protein